jgi:hypothetical protein
MGPKIQTYAEHPCDAISPFAGFYTETDGHEVTVDGVKRTEWRPRTSLELIETCSWLLDTPVPVVTRGGEIPWRYENRITPLVPDYGAEQWADEVRGLNEQYLDNQGRWR